MPASPDDLFTLLQQAVALHASDLHLSAGLPPMARVMGALVPLGNNNAQDDSATAMQPLTHDTLLASVPGGHCVSEPPQQVQR